jgi:hypothetical protein
MGFVVMIYATNELQAVRIVDRYADGDAGAVVGMYEMGRKSDATCSGNCSRNRTAGWSRHPKKGYMMHSCGKRHRDWRKRIATTLMDIFGVNLLRRESTPGIFRNPNGWDI